MGQRSQIYVRWYDPEIERWRLSATYFQWNYGERMISRVKSVIELFKYNIDNGFDFSNADNFNYTDRVGVTGGNKLEMALTYNFDMKSYVANSNIILGCYNDCCESNYEDSYINNRNSSLFGQDNNDGIAFISIKGKDISYCMADYDNKLLSIQDYIKWDGVDPEAKSYTEDNSKYITDNATLMSAEDLFDFFNTDYYFKDTSIGDYLKSASEITETYVLDNFMSDYTKYNWNFLHVLEHLRNDKVFYDKVVERYPEEQERINYFFLYSDNEDIKSVIEGNGIKNKSVKKKSKGLHL